MIVKQYSVQFGTEILLSTAKSQTTMIPHGETLKLTSSHDDLRRQRLLLPMSL
jgi:hypothetical protein